VIRRFINWFTDFGIPVGGVIVNQVIEVDDPDRVPEFVRNRMEMQREHMQVIREEFGDQVRAVVPLYDDEVRGVPALERAAGVLLD
jgi:arsenite-transporting ATPase